MAAVIVKEGFRVKEGFQLDETTVKSVQRPPKLEVKPSALNDILPTSLSLSGKRTSSEGINGSLSFCNAMSTCQVRERRLHNRVSLSLRSISSIQINFFSSPPRPFLFRK
jgi:hypothetical protein